jgi:bacteriocin-like protein
MFIALNDHELAQIIGGFDVERALVSGAQYMPIGAAAGSAIGTPTGALVGGLSTSPVLGVGAIPGAFYGSMVGGAVGGTLGWGYGVGKDTINQLRGKPAAK